MWYISFAAGANGVNNILVYHDSGHPHARPELLPTGKDDPPLQEVRGFAVAGRLLYVVNAHDRLSQILVYETDGNGDYRFKAVLASMAEVSSLVHPYDLTFDSQGNCYVSSQDTNVVTGLGAAGGALEVAAHRQELYPPPGTFLAGTRVASSLGLLPGIQPLLTLLPDVGVPHGLAVGFADHTRTRVAHSVRGVVWHDGHLYVADEPADAVKVYEVETGKFCGQIAGDNLRAPVQLLLDAAAGVLYIGSSGNDRVVTYDLAQGAPTGTVAPRTFRCWSPWTQRNAHWLAAIQRLPDRAPMGRDRGIHRQPDQSQNHRTCAGSSACRSASTAAVARSRRRLTLHTQQCPVTHAVDPDAWLLTKPGVLLCAAAEMAGGDEVLTLVWYLEINQFWLPFSHKEMQHDS